MSIMTESPIAITPPAVALAEATHECEPGTPTAGVVVVVVVVDVVVVVVLVVVLVVVEALVVVGMANPSECGRGPSRPGATTAVLSRRATAAAVQPATRQAPATTAHTLKAR
jgi:hypothetical protein